MTLMTGIGDVAKSTLSEKENMKTIDLQCAKIKCKISGVFVLHLG